MNNPAEHPSVTSSNPNPNLIAEHINNVWETLQAEKLESYKSIFKAFSTLSDAQELIALGSPEQANDLINKAKSFINDAIMTGDAGKNTELYSRAMSQVFIEGVETNHRNS